MKKLLVAAVAAVALMGAAFAQAHPRTYVIDPLDTAEGKTGKIEIAYNQYGPNYQTTLNFWSNVKGDKPVAGDTIQLRTKITSSIDLPYMQIFIADNSPAANYWANLSDKVIVEGFKAGEEKEISLDYVLTADTKGSCIIVLQYDVEEGKALGHANIGKAAKASFTKAADSTKIAAAPKRKKPKTWKVDISKSLMMQAFECQYDQSGKPTWYQCLIKVTDQFNLADMPIKGDTIVFTYTGISNVDIPELRIDVVENSSAAPNWWGDLDTENNHITIVKDVKAGVKFTGTATNKLTTDAVQDITIQVTYEPFEGSKTATIKYAK